MEAGAVPGVSSGPVPRVHEETNYDISWVYTFFRERG